MLIPLYIFLDVDGVLNAYYSRSHGKLSPEHIDRLDQLLDQLIEAGFEPRIVFNTAWNGHGMPKLRKMFIEHGFRHESYLYGNTSSSQGGGTLVREWLEDHDCIGERFIIIDDEPRRYDDLWCKLIWCKGDEGFTSAKVVEAYVTAVRPLNELVERKSAAAKLMQRCEHLGQRATWLSPEDSRKYIRGELDKIADIFTKPNFLEAAYLKRKPSHNRVVKPWSKCTERLEHRAKWRITAELRRS